MARPRRAVLLLCGVLVLALSSAGLSQDYGARLGVRRGGDLSFSPQGPGVLFGALDPTVKQWRVPQELYADYGWRQWRSTNYAREQYQRYVSTTQQGDYFYDFYGNFIDHGWLIYDWRQDQPKQPGSSLFQDAKFVEWFNSVTIGGDQKGQYHYTITVGDRIRTTLTPMTFSKPSFDGVQIDFASDKYAATVIASRINDPISGQTRDPSTLTNATSLFGGRATAQLGDLIEVGATLVDARTANTALDLFDGDLFAGSLAAGQGSIPLNAIAVVLSDDSPDDENGGAALFSHEVRITSRDFETGRETVQTLAQVVRPGSAWPIVFGGFRRRDFLAADGAERIVVNYDFRDPAYIGPDPTAIVRVEFDYILANDYRIQIWSDRQTGRNALPAVPLTPQAIVEESPALLTVRRADGNVTDGSNLQRVRFDYGLPTANLVGGFTLGGTDVWGFDFYGEWDRNRRYSQYPNAALFSQGKRHEISAASSEAWYGNLSKQAFPWFGYLEGYSLDADYSTSAFIVDPKGNILYDDAQRHLYEFVDDNDDQDRFADWTRANSVQDRLIFPGWDENNDFISDFNQNDNSAVSNTIPDYEEPFLRYVVDRPEFLFGIDLNNNDWIDRFEDDDLPDYPYKPDRRGYNAFVGVHVTPAMRLFLGRTDERMLSADRKNETDYALFTLDRDYPGFGRLRVFEMLKRARDRIPDDRRAPTPFIESVSVQPLVKDLLPFQDTWVNTAWVGLDYDGVPGLNVSNKIKWEIFRQADDDRRDIEGRLLDSDASFFGLINKADYHRDLGRVAVQPKVKSEFLRRAPFLAQDERLESWTGTALLVTQLPLLTHTVIRGGLEILWLRDLGRDEDEMMRTGVAGETGDLQTTTFALQLSTISDYLGYRLTTEIGVRLSRTRTELVRTADAGAYVRDDETGTETVSFVTVYAGVE